MKTDTVIQMRPSAYAEHQLVTALLDGTYPPGSTLPNERSLAAELGMTNTHYKNSTGLPAEGHYTSATDIATLATALVKEFVNQCGLAVVDMGDNRHISDLILVHYSSCGKYKRRIAHLLLSVKKG